MFLPGSPMRHAFVSYSHTDPEFPRLLQDKLHEADFPTWRDLALNVGDDWRTDIDGAIRDSFATIVVLSRASIRSAYVNYEWAFALGSGVAVIPILLEAVGEELHPRLRNMSCLDFTRESARPWDSLIQALSDLQDALRPNTVHVPRDAPPALQQVAQGLDSLDEKERQAAIDTLGKMDHRLAIEVLADALRHPIKQVRLGAALRLVDCKDPRAIPELLEGLRTRHEEVEPWMLGDMGPAAVPGLIELLKTGNKDVQRDVSAQLGRIGNSEALGVLKERLRDPDQVKRWDAVHGLAQTADPAMLPVLLEMRHDPDWGVRRRVVMALWECAIGATAVDSWMAGKSNRNADARAQVFPELLEALEDAEEQVAIEASRGLAKIGDAQAVPSLLRAILARSSNNFYSFAKDDLRTLGSPPVAAIREAAISQDPAVRAMAIRLLTEMGGNESDIPLLIDASRDMDREVRTSAVDGLQKFPSRSAVPVLIDLLEDEDRVTSRTSALALANIGDPDSVPALIKSLKDYNVADLAASALHKIGTPEARAAARAWEQQQKG